MTNEEMQRTMEFILEQQDQTTVKLDRVSENLGVLTGKVDALAALQERNEKKWERTEEGIRALLGIAELHEREITSLGKTIASLSEVGHATDERLNALINVVERHISEGRNGKP